MAPKSQGEAAQEGSFSAKGFAGGITSGLTKLMVGHPFDTIKVRQQTSAPGTYKGPIDCLVQLVRKESLLGLYKGASPPAVGWMITDSILMGSLHTYRIALSRWSGTGEGSGKRLPTYLHAVAGLGAGWTTSIFTNPIELIKCRLQMQTQRVSLHFPGRHSSAPVKVEYSGPIDCAMQTIRHSGVKGLWHALPSTLIMRSNFFFMFASYDVFNRTFESWKGTSWEISPGFATFLSGGLASQVFWSICFPLDTIKNRMMADTLRNPKYPTWRSTAKAIWNERGPSQPLRLRLRPFYTGFLVCQMRAFPVNSSALLVFETTMSFMGAEKTSTI
jgi:solute carrier family 25 carnitine/acylcarnitine transporter 20/29